MICKVCNDLDELGKVTATINLINNSPKEENFIYVTSSNEKSDMVVRECPDRRFLVCKSKPHTQMKNMVRTGHNFIMTQDVLRDLDADVISLIALQDYTLILSNPLDCIEQLQIGPYDTEDLLTRYASTDENHFLHWKAEYAKYGDEKFKEEKALCDKGVLASYKDAAILRIFPVETVKAFKTVYVLAYMFVGSMMRCYCDFYGIRYSYVHIEGEEGDSYFADGDIGETSSSYGRFINILDYPAINAIGNEDKFALSYSWFLHSNDGKKENIRSLQRNIYNFFQNIVHGYSALNMWTTFDLYQDRLSGNGYSKGFVSQGEAEISRYKDKINLAYAADVHVNPIIKNFLAEKGVTTADDEYALSCMMPWIFQSAVKEQEEITIYVPSKRMRTLLQGWVEHNM